MWGTPIPSRAIVTGALMPAATSVPLVRGSEGPSKRRRANSSAAAQQSASAAAATTARMMVDRTGAPMAGGRLMVRTRLRGSMAARTPLYDRHLALGARMVEFGGYDMPLQYSSIREEHVGVRTRAGLFDLSHMGEVRISGDGAEPAVQHIITNDLGRVAVGGALYSVMGNEHGGIVDDVVVYRDDDSGVVGVNAASRQKAVGGLLSPL